jgi:hypothetical protein
MPYYAGLDVTDVLDDPDFQVPITVLSTVEQIGPGGLATAVALVPGGVIAMAVVVSDGGRDLVQTDEGDSVQGDITVYTRFPLTTGSVTRAPDIVIWNDDQYRIIRAQPWLYGAGYTQAICKLATLNPQDPPGTTPTPTPAPPGGYLG